MSLVKAKVWMKYMLSLHDFSFMLHNNHFPCNPYGSAEGIFDGYNQLLVFTTPRCGAVAAGICILHR